MSPSAVQSADLREYADLVGVLESRGTGFSTAWERGGSVGARFHGCSERARFHDEPPLAKAESEPKTTLDDLLSKPKPKPEWPS